MTGPIRFELLAACGKARRARIHTPHGVIDTPAFMPVGTRATVKGVSPSQLAETGAQIVLANTYHMLLRPGPEVVASLGGLHRMMNWIGAILTDSGGFQVFSLADLRSLDDDGVAFRSHIDGAIVRMSPESSIQTQNQLGADIIMAFDECPPLRADATAAQPEEGQRATRVAADRVSKTTIESAVRRTVAWARRSRAAHARGDQALYGIVQGGLDANLRASCLSELVEIGFDGYALGGLSVGEPPPEMWSFLDSFADRLPRDRPRYLMGVGTPRDLVEAVFAGIDQFDCVMPTRNGRKGYAFTESGVLRLKNARHRLSTEPLDPGCDCHACCGFSRGYIRHLLSVEEVLGATLVSIHNLAFYQRLMSRMRREIEQGGLVEFRRSFLAGPYGSAAGEETE